MGESGLKLSIADLLIAACALRAPAATANKRHGYPITWLVAPHPLPNGGGARIRPEIFDPVEFVATGGEVAEDTPYRLVHDNTVLIIAIDELKPQQYRIFNIDLLDANSRPLVADD